MPTRRRFLHTTLLAIAAPALPAATTIGTARAPQCMVEILCCDTRAFTGAARDVVLLDADPAAGLNALSADCWFGLTRAAHQFVVTELAAARGYRLVYRGEHTYRAGVLAHRLHGTAALVEHYARILGAAGRAWPLALAQAAPVLADSSDLHTERASRTTVNPPADSPAHLVSWCLRRA